MTRLVMAFATLCALIASPMTWAHGYELGELSIEHPWSRATPPGTPTGGGFMTIHNHGNDSDFLLGGHSDFTQSISVHQTRMDESNMTMKMDAMHDGLEIPAGGSVTLEPGSYHLMLMGLQSPLKEGERRTITLEFEHAGSIEVDLAVDAIGAMPEHNH
ncbi:copper chaperone PCu(A)C [Saccharospirillum mangrovi]|uniref:copper chaperone PCu(A)C n=1 Tax=Saccharospirillum mangrovi TaxID=2161747 RepID=UPI0018E548B4|nr:copper chaperone PCu(A)C [Saccharospirillum mangrovi]